MSSLSLASKGYVDNSIVPEYTDTKTGDVKNVVPTIAMFPSVYTYVYNKLGEKLELTHLCFPVFTPTKDNVYLGIAGNSFTSGTPVAVTEEAFSAGTHRYIWFKLIRPKIYEYDLSEGWSNEGYTDILELKGTGRLHMLEKTVVDGKDVYTSVGVITTTSSTADVNVFYPLNPTNVQFSTTGEELEYGGFKCGRFCIYFGKYYSVETLLGLKYKIYKTGGGNPEALATTAYVNSKAGKGGGDDSLASKEYVDSLT